MSNAAALACKYATRVKSGERIFDELWHLGREWSYFETLTQLTPNIAASLSCASLCQLQRRGTQIAAGAACCNRYTHPYNNNPVAALNVAIDYRKLQEREQ
jgi:hypothetical protein